MSCRPSGRGASAALYGCTTLLASLTEIAFDPYQKGRILVGTRQAGIVCSADAGATWRTIFDSAKINYVTGFHFRPDGGVYIGSYGHGLWLLKATTGCPKAEDLPWDRGPVVPPVATAGGALARDGAARGDRRTRARPVHETRRELTAAGGRREAEQPRVHPLKREAPRAARAGSSS
jgi:hypothetical protein